MEFRTNALHEFIEQLQSSQLGLFHCYDNVNMLASALLPLKTFLRTDRVTLDIPTEMAVTEPTVPLPQPLQSKLEQMALMKKLLIDSNKAADLKPETEETREVSEQPSTNPIVLESVVTIKNRAMNMATNMKEFYPPPDVNSTNSIPEHEILDLGSVFYNFYIALVNPLLVRNGKFEIALHTPIDSLLRIWSVNRADSEETEEAEVTYSDTESEDERPPASQPSPKNKNVETHFSHNHTLIPLVCVAESVCELSCNCIESLNYCSFC